jgi:protoporphyrinogen/coproporphyrinogen III oxidase
MVGGVLTDIMQGRNRPDALEDESVDSFFTRRFGKVFAHHFISPLVHGIYAADSRELSIRAAFPLFWEAEDDPIFGGVVGGMLSSSLRRSKEQGHNYDVGDVPNALRDQRIFSFGDAGMSTLVQALEQRLASQPNIKILKEEEVVSLRVGSEDNNIEVRPTALIHRHNMFANETILAHNKTNILIIRYS